MNTQKKKDCFFYEDKVNKRVKISEKSYVKVNPTILDDQMNMTNDSLNSKS